MMPVQIGGRGSAMAAGVGNAEFVPSGLGTDDGLPDIGDLGQVIGGEVGVGSFPMGGSVPVQTPCIGWPSERRCFL